MLPELVSPVNGSSNPLPPWPSGLQGLMILNKWKTWLQRSGINRKNIRPDGFIGPSFASQGNTSTMHSLALLTVRSSWFQPWSLDGLANCRPSLLPRWIPSLPYLSFTPPPSPPFPFSSLSFPHSFFPSMPPPSFWLNSKIGMFRP